MYISSQHSASNKENITKLFKIKVPKDAIEEPGFPKEPFSQQFFFEENILIISRTLFTIMNSLCN